MFVPNAALQPNEFVSIDSIIAAFVAKHIFSFCFVLCKFLLPTFPTTQREKNFAHTEMANKLTI